MPTGWPCVCVCRRIEVRACVRARVCLVCECVVYVSGVCVWCVRVVCVWCARGVCVAWCLCVYVVSMCVW